MFCASDKAVETLERPKIFEQEEAVLKFSGLELNKELFVYDVAIELNGRIHKIHTYRCGDDNTEDLVLLHGYAGSSALYYGMLKDLSKRFRVFCLDFLGMGLSSRDKFEFVSPEETMELFLESLEKWREVVGLDTFILAGHSFGGHMSAQYALRHQHRVKKLILLSPVGVTKHEKDPTLEDIKKRFGFMQRMVFSLIHGWATKAWERKLTPSQFMSEHPWIGKMVVKNYVNKRFGLKATEAQVVYDLMWSMLNLPEGSEKAIHYILKPPFASARFPLEDLIAEELQMPVDCFFGEFDYMDQTGAKRIPQKDKTGKFTHKVLPKAAHQLTVQNPKELANQIILSC